MLVRRDQHDVGELRLGFSSNPSTDSSFEVVGILFALFDRGMQHLAAMQNLRVLWLGRTFVSSSGLAQLAKLTNLETLVLSETATSDPALEHLRPLKKLKELHLWRTRISDEGLTVVSELENLETLLVGGNPITDSGFAKLGKLKRFKRLDLSESTVSGKGLAEFSDRATLEDLKLVAIRPATSRPASPQSDAQRQDPRTCQPTPHHR